jgi:tetratricopeptide (TPR) repeat protein
MELITGDPIDAYVARQELDVPATVALFVQVIAAVQHAHGQNVVHRDLKPANILVRPDGQVKVLDFGVARLTDTDLNATLQSEVGQILGTLPYMSPEQVRGNHHEIDGRTDVYAIGVALFQVLTGRLPLDLDEGNLASAVRRIEEEPARALVGRPGDPHHSYPAALATIVGKCLAKDPDQRYASAADLGADLQRFLDDQPIAARPPSTLEQARQFAARNRGLVTGLSVAAVILVVGCAVAVTGWVAADKARRLASREANRAEAVNSFLLDMLAAPDPWASGPEVKVVEVLDRAAARIDSSLASNAVAAAEAHATVATSYEGLAVYDKAGAHYRRAYTLTRGVDDVARRVRMLRNLVQFEIADGRLAEVDSLVVEMESELGQLASGSPPRAEALHVLGSVAEARGELATAEARFREALDISRTVLGPTDAATLATQLNLGVILMQEEQLAEARDLVTPVYETRRTRLGVEHPQTLIAVNNLAVIYRGLGRHEEALEMCRLSLAAREKVHGPVSPSAMVGQHNLGLQLGRMERFADALPHHERAVAIAEESLGPDHPRAWIARAALGRAQFQVGQLSAADKTLSAAVAGLETHFGTDHWRTLAAAAHLAELQEGPAD